MTHRPVTKQSCGFLIVILQIMFFLRDFSKCLVHVIMVLMCVCLCFQDNMVKSNIDKKFSAHYDAVEAELKSSTVGTCFMLHIYSAYKTSDSQRITPSFSITEQMCHERLLVRKTMFPQQLKFCY